MKKLLLCCFAVLCNQLYAQYVYPVPPTSNDTIHEFGYSIPDVYRPLEAINSDKTQEWLQKEDEVLRKYRNNVFAKYTVMEREIVYTMWADSVSNYLKSKSGAYYFHLRYDYATDNSPVIEYKTKLSHGWGKVISTAQFLRNKDDVIDVKWLLVSRDDSTLAVGISHSGSDWTEIYLVNMHSMKLYPEKIQWTKYGMAWANGGFFYSQFERPEGNEITSRSNKSKIMFHRIGTNPDADQVVSDEGDENSSFYTAQQGRIFVLYQMKNMNGRKVGTFSYVYTDSVATAPLRNFMIAPGLEETDVDVLGEVNGRLLAKSYYKAPRGKLVMLNPYKVNEGRMFMEMFTQTLLSAKLNRHLIFCTYMDEGKYLTIVFDTTGKAVKTINAPEGMALSGFEKPYTDSTTYYFIESFSMPRVTMRFNLNTLQSELPDENAGFALSSKYITKIVSYYGKDSTKLFMYLTYNKDMKPDPNTPVLMYAYGGFNTVTGPDYNPMYGMLLRRNAIIAVPLVRGGGEFGTSWHEAGRGKNKQNSVDDFCAAAQWLIDNKYSSPSKIAITGGSQGGWLVATAAVQRPELFNVVVPMAGIYDMLRYHLYASTANVGFSEFGNPESETDFPHLYNISPTYHIKPDSRYPNFLIIIGSNDDRVVPMHSYKLAAALQHTPKEKGTQLLYLEKNTGHSVTSSNEGLQQVALMYTFILDQLGMKIM